MPIRKIVKKAPWERVMENLRAWASRHPYLAFFAAIGMLVLFSLPFRSTTPRPPDDPVASTAVALSRQPKPTALPTAPTPRPPTPVPPTATPVAKIGQLVKGKNWEYTATKVERPDAITWASAGNTEKAVGKWLLVYLTLKNVGTTNHQINAWDFEAHDGKGITYKTSDKYAATVLPEAMKLQRIGQQVPPGVPIQTVVVFDTAPDASGMKLWLVQEKVLVDLGL